MTRSVKIYSFNGPIVLRKVFTFMITAHIGPVYMPIDRVDSDAIGNASFVCYGFKIISFCIE